jgi:hypothetical protein
MCVCVCVCRLGQAGGTSSGSLPLAFSHKLRLLSRVTGRMAHVLEIISATSSDSCRARVRDDVRSDDKGSRGRTDGDKSTRESVSGGGGGLMAAAVVVVEVMVLVGVEGVSSSSSSVSL